MRKARGYTGYYGKVYLRSFLEFAYAYYLDHKNTAWKYEVKTFELGEYKYKPDFFIYNSNGKLVKIVEIKGSGYESEGYAKIKDFKSKYPTDIELITRKDLVQIYREEMPIYLEEAKRLWIGEYGAILGQTSMHGKNNPMYGRKHSEESKRKIAEKAKKRFSEGSPYLDTNTAKMIAHNRKNNFQHTKGNRVPRVENTCKNCGTVFKTTKKSVRDYCSHKCFRRSDENRERMSEVAHKQIQKYQNRANEVKTTILNWSIENKEAVLTTKLNRINDTFYSLYDLLEEEYGITDKRTISAYLFGEDRGRKEMVKYLKEYVSA